MLFAAKQDLNFFSITYLLACAITLSLRLPFLVANLLLFGAPAGVLLWRRPELLRRLHPVFFGLLVLFACMVIGYPNELFRGWFVPSVLPFRLKGLALEEVEFAAFFILFMLLAYEGLIRRASSNEREVASVSGYGAGTGLIVLFCLGIALPFSPRLLSNVSTHVYMKTAAFFAFTSIGLAIYERPTFMKELIGICIIGIPIISLFEIVGLRLKYWNFPGDYLAYSVFFVQPVPIEEIVFFIILCWPSTAAVQSVFDSKLRRSYHFRSSLNRTNLR